MRGIAFIDWIKNKDEYGYAGDGAPELMYGFLEEHLNYHGQIQETASGSPEPKQIDLLIPVKRKVK